MLTASSVMGIFKSFIPGFRLIDGGELQALGNELFSCETGITASTTSTQAAAYPLNAVMNVVTTADSGNTDAVKLPFAIPGRRVFIENRTANSIVVFGEAKNPVTGIDDTIIPNNSVSETAGATGVAQVTAVLAVYICTTPGIWKKGSMA